MSTYSGFGLLTDGAHPIWVGPFTGGAAGVLFYYQGDHNWWHGALGGAPFNWKLAGNTAGFGNVNDGRPFWTGRFSQTQFTQILFYSPSDDNWWLGTIDSALRQLTWSLAGNTSGFGHDIDDGRPFWIGDFNGDGRAEVLFYYPGDDNWWLGSFDAQRKLTWKLVGNTAGFGHAINDGRPFWIGRFSAAGRDEVLFYYPGDDNWWLGTLDDATGTWSWKLVGNTVGFGHGIYDGRPFWIGDFRGTGRSDVLFYYPGDDNWWHGHIDDSTGKLVWSLAGNTAGFGHDIDDGRPFWTGNFSRFDRTEILFYYPGDDNWWLGTYDKSTRSLQWRLVSNTAGFGHGINDGRPFWIGDFSGDGRSDVLFYYPGDGNWWLGRYDDTTAQLVWGLVGNTGRPCKESFTVHFKTLLPLTAARRTWLEAQFGAMEDLFSRVGIAPRLGTFEDLSGNATLAAFSNFNVGACLRGQPTADHTTVFANRNNAGSDELVVYLAQTLTGGAGNFVGCATHPANQPGLVLVQTAANWLLAHEVGHVLSLPHVDNTIATNSDFLMWPNTGWTNVPPDLASGEVSKMLGSGYTKG